MTLLPLSSSGQRPRRPPADSEVGRYVAVAINRALTLRCPIAVLACWAIVATLGCRSGRLVDSWGADQPRDDPHPATQPAPEPTDRELADADPAPPADQLSDPTSDEPVDLLQINDDSVTVEDVLRPLRDDLADRARAMSADRYREYLIDALQKEIRAQARDVLLYQEASRRLTDQEAEIFDKFTDQRIRRIVQEKHGGRQSRWERAMAEKGLSAEQAREKVRRDLVVMRYLQTTLTPRIQEPTRRELIQYFEQRKDEWAAPERREMFLIEIAKGEDPDSARATAEQALAKLEAGADFAEVARQQSAGIHAAEGGAWGPVSRDSLRSRWANAAEALFQLPPGGTSGVVECDECFFIVRLGLIEPAHEPSFAEVQRTLIETYRDQQFNALVDELVTRLQEQAIIRPADLSLFLRAVLQRCPTPSTN